MTTICLPGASPSRDRHNSSNSLYENSADLPSMSTVSMSRSLECSDMAVLSAVNSPVIETVPLNLPESACDKSRLRL